MDVLILQNQIHLLVMQKESENDCLILTMKLSNVNKLITLNLRDGCGCVDNTEPDTLVGDIEGE